MAVWIATGCSAHGTVPSERTLQLPTPKSVSPALIPAAPMAKTAILPSSAMRSPVTPLSAIAGLNWTQIPGSASQVAAAPDGSLWALSTQPAGPDKYIWHYAGSAWTNISGLAAHLAVAPDGTLYALNSGGGTYHYSGGSWTALGGGASAITVAPDGSIYVLSNAAGSDRAIWHNVNGAWSQSPGSGTALAANWDMGGPYAVDAGTIRPGGFYILNSAGAIWYENSDGSFARLSGNASAIAPAGRGVFVLGYPADINGNSIYYYDLDAPGWNAQGGAGTGISADTNLYAVGASGAIYSSPVPVRGGQLPVRGVWAAFERRGWSAEYYNGEVIAQFNDFDSVVGTTVKNEIALQLDKMRMMGVNTITFPLVASDPSAPSFTPPTCYEPPAGGLQYPQPTNTELANLVPFFDLVNSKGMKIDLLLINTHMEEQPPVNNSTWVNAILQPIKNHPALAMVLFGGDVHVNNFNNTPSCGIPAGEPPLWLGPDAPPGQYVKWAMSFANSIGIPYSKLSAEAIVGSYLDENSPSLYSPIAVMKGIYDSLGVPDTQREYALSFYEHRKCKYVPAGNTCTDEDPNAWADETMQYIFATIGRSGAHAVATEYGNDTPVDPSWSTASAVDSLLTLMERYGMDGGSFWLWVNTDNSRDSDPTLADPVKRRGLSFTYNPVEGVLGRHYTAP